MCRHPTHEFHNKDFRPLRFPMMGHPNSRRTGTSDCNGLLSAIRTTIPSRRVTGLGLTIMLRHSGNFFCSLVHLSPVICSPFARTCGVDPAEATWDKLCSEKQVIFRQTQHQPSIKMLPNARTQTPMSSGNQRSDPGTMLSIQLNANVPSCRKRDRHMPLEGVCAQARPGALHQTIICCRNQRLGTAKRSLRSRHTEMAFKHVQT